MIFFPFFFRKRSFAAHALVGQPWLIVFLLSSTLCFFASSYTIDASCRNYEGNDITGDIEQSIHEIRDMASNAFVQLLKRASNTNRLLNVLFGMNPRGHNTINYHFAAFARLGSTEPFVVICGDSMVNREPDRIHSPPDPRGVWTDYEHDWLMFYDDFVPCDPSRRFGSINRHAFRPRSFTVFSRLIYLCPVTLDNPKGRSLAPYKNQILAREVIDRYMLVPVILFHELLHTHITWRLKDVEVRDFPSPDFLRSHTLIEALNPAIQATLLMVPAFGFSLCMKLGAENPAQAVSNADSVALLALGLYLHKNDWSLGIGIPIPP